MLQSWVRESFVCRFLILVIRHKYFSVEMIQFLLESNEGRQTDLGEMCQIGPNDCKQTLLGLRIAAFWYIEHTALFGYSHLKIENCVQCLIVDSAVSLARSQCFTYPELRVSSRAREFTVQSFQWQPDFAIVSFFVIRLNSHSILGKQYARGLANNNYTS